MGAPESQQTSTIPNDDVPETFPDELETPWQTGDVEILHSKDEKEPPCKRNKQGKFTF